jgi:hypothetical protein
LHVVGERVDITGQPAAQGVRDGGRNSSSSVTKASVSS